LSYNFSRIIQGPESNPFPSIEGLVQGKDGDRMLIDSPPSSTQGRYMDHLEPDGPDFWGFENIEKKFEDNISNLKLTDVSAKLTFENPALNYAAKLVQFKGGVSWTASLGGLEPSAYEGFILLNSDMCMNVLSQNFPLELSSTKGKFIFTSGSSLGHKKIGWEISERCDLGCQKCQPREKYVDENTFLDLFMGETPVQLEEGENGNIQV
jgi:hypothetical protein